MSHTSIRSVFVCFMNLLPEERCSANACHNFCAMLATCLEPCIQRAVSEFTATAIHALLHATEANA